MLPLELKKIILDYILQLMDYDLKIEKNARRSYLRIVLQVKRLRMRPLYEFWWWQSHISQRVFVIERFGHGLWALCRTPCFHWLADL